MNNQPLEILDIYDISYNPWWLQKWFLYSCIALGIVIIAMVGYLLYQNYKTEPEISAQEAALQKLADLKKAKLQSPKEFYIRLTTLLKEYLEKDYAINLVGKTDAEFLDTIKENHLFSETIIDAVKEILDGVTLIKFANQSAAQEQMQQALKLSLKIIKENKSLLI